MKKIFYSLVTASILLVACKGNNDSKEAKDSTAENTATSNSSGSNETANQSKNYEVSFTPDSAVIGKQHEALVKLTGGTAVVIQDADGKDEGLELNLKLTLTNKLKIDDGASIHVDYTDSRLQLDNGTSITSESGTDFLRADPEATSKEETWTYKIPAGTKPAALSLFLDGTRASVNIALKD
ncbi:MAG: hypothetical protein ABJA35_06930 [Parafilimonas sp.]